MDEAIYRAWYTTSNPPSNVLLGYELKEQVAQGAFGRVFKAQDKSGSEVAIKVLLHEVRNRPDFMQCFRRGVRSMKILAEHDLAGMVKYHEAAEIPAFVVMDWVDGPSLQHAVESSLLFSWSDVLKVSLRLSKTILSAHRLTERVLHRDIRPSNVMLRGFWQDHDNWDLVVLDFDLSWHKGASEKSITQGTSMTGYLAPEQLNTIPNVSTRHSGVDAFGLGMTFFFLIAGRHPVPLEHRHTDWSITLKNAAGQLNANRWRSLPNRFARLIKNATEDQQSRRIDVAHIVGELDSLTEALVDPLSVESAELIAEEIVASSQFADDYIWDESALSATVHMRSGTCIVVKGDESTRSIKLSLEWSRSNLDNRKSVLKFLPGAIDKGVSALHKVGWGCTRPDVNANSIMFEASLPIEKAKSSSLKKVGESIEALFYSLQMP